MMRDVCSADNRSVEPTKITASQITTGRQYLNKNFIRRSEVGDRATVSCIDHLIPHFRFGFLHSAAQLQPFSKLEINKRHWTGCRQEFKRQKRENVCRDLNACWSERQSINELIPLLGHSQNHGDQPEHDRIAG